MKKIIMKTPLVEMDGDAVAREMWHSVKETLLLPFLDLNTCYFDLCLPERKRTKNAVVQKSVEAMHTYGVGVKCPTAADKELPEEDAGDTELRPSPSNKISTALTGTIFHKTIPSTAFQPLIPTWNSPITIAEYTGIGNGSGASGLRLPSLGRRPSLVCSGGKSFDQSVYASLPLLISKELESAIEAQCVNDAEISYAHTCIQYALSEKQDLWIAVSPSKRGATGFENTFRSVFAPDYRKAFETTGIRCLFVDESDLVAKVLRSGGGFIIASTPAAAGHLIDLASAAFGSRAMLQSVLVTPNGIFEYEVAQGSVARDSESCLEAGKSYYDPSATVFAWTGALRQRGKLDELPQVIKFADALEAAVIDTAGNGVFTCDLSISGENTAVTANEFLAAVRVRLLSANLAEAIPV